MRHKRLACYDMEMALGLGQMEWRACERGVNGVLNEISDLVLK